ncbi:MAG: hypothetical protein K8H87_00705 [Pseudorhodoplanes sp.]|nr:hypothetical protein [Pseudorhodoplanes sp.]
MRRILYKIVESDLQALGNTSIFANPSVVALRVSEHAVQADRRQKRP